MRDLTDVPHCPECHRADRVEARPGPSHEFYCDQPTCQTVFYPDDVVDGPWVDLSSDFMFDDPEETTLQAGKIIFADDCTCTYCTRLEEGDITTDEMMVLVHQNAVEKFCE